MSVKKYLLCLILLTISQQTLGFNCHIEFRSIQTASKDKLDQFADTVIHQAGCSVSRIAVDEFVSLNRRLVMLEQGKVDLIVGLNKTPDRESYAYFSKPIAEERVVLWARSENAKPIQGQNLSDFINQGFTILAPDAGWYGAEYEHYRLQKHPQIIFYSSIEHGLMIFHKGRGDLLLGSEHFELYFEPSDVEMTRQLPIVLHTDQLRLMYSKKTVPLEIVEQIDTVIEQHQKAAL